MQKELSEFEKKFLGAQLGKPYLKRSSIEVGSKWRIVDIDITTQVGRNPKTEVKLENDKGYAAWTSFTAEQSRLLQEKMNNAEKAEDYQYVVLYPELNVDDGKYSLRVEWV